jgi:hypothetical protein
VIKEFVLSKHWIRDKYWAIFVRQNAETSKILFTSLRCTKETNEVVYWLELLKATDYLNEKEYMKI